MSEQITVSPEFVRKLGYVCECQMATLEELKGLASSSITRIRRQEKIVEHSIELIKLLGVEQNKLLSLLSNRTPRLKKELSKSPLQRLAEV